MPKYTVEISRSQTHTTTIEVEADNEDLAEKAALKVAKSNIPDWSELEDETFEVESIEEVTE